MEKPQKWLTEALGCFAAVQSVFIGAHHIKVQPRVVQGRFASQNMHTNAAKVLRTLIDCCCPRTLQKDTASDSFCSVQRQQRSVICPD